MSASLNHDWIESLHKAEGPTLLDGIHLSDSLQSVSPNSSAVYSCSLGALGLLITSGAIKQTWFKTTKQRWRSKKSHSVRNDPWSEEGLDMDSTHGSHVDKSTCRHLLGPSCHNLQHKKSFTDNYCHLFRSWGFWWWVIPFWDDWNISVQYRLPVSQWDVWCPVEAHWRM